MSAETQTAVPTGYVGFDTVTTQIQKKLLKRGFHFNIMVVGQSGLGKSTLVNTLFSTHLVDPKIPSSDSTENGLTSKKTTEIRQVSYAVEENGVKMKLNIIDTPGYGDQVNNDYCADISWEPVTRYIKDQYAMYLRKELSPARDKHIPDTRVHCVLYFIGPTGHALRPLDIIVMKKLGEICNVIPVISKSDTLTQQEREDFKRRINEEIIYHGIAVYPQAFLDEDDSEDKVLNDAIRSILPFAIVGSEKMLQINGKLVRARKVRSGIVNVEDPTHCEFVDLRNFLIRSHLQSLVETTALVHYENFRTKQLMALKEASKSSQQN